MSQKLCRAGPTLNVKAGNISNRNKHLERPFCRPTDAVWPENSAFSIWTKLHWEWASEIWRIWWRHSRDRAKLCPVGRLTQAVGDQWWEGELASVPCNQVPDPPIPDTAAIRRTLLTLCSAPLHCPEWWTALVVQGAGDYHLCILPPLPSILPLPTPLVNCCPWMGRVPGTGTTSPPTAAQICRYLRHL